MNLVTLQTYCEEMLTLTEALVKDPDLELEYKRKTGAQQWYPQGKEAPLNFRDFTYRVKPEVHTTFVLLYEIRDADGNYGEVLKSPNYTNRQKAMDKAEQTNVHPISILVMETVEGDSSVKSFDNF